MAFILTGLRAGRWPDSAAGPTGRGPPARLIKQTFFSYHRAGIAYGPQQSCIMDNNHRQFAERQLIHWQSLLAELETLRAASPEDLAYCRAKIDRLQTSLTES